MEGSLDFVFTHLARLPHNCEHCASEVVMTCFASGGGRDCGQCVQEFDWVDGCSVLEAQQDPAPYIPGGCLQCIVELGLHCSSETARFLVNTDCDNCVADCEALREHNEDGDPLDAIIDGDCFSCTSQILEECAADASLQHDACRTCAEDFQDAQGCEAVFSGHNPFHKAGAQCQGCLMESAMHCALQRRPTVTAMRSLPDILREREVPIKRLIVVGLTYDYCISETAIFAMEGRELWLGEDFAEANDAVTVLTDLTRPSFDGKPGAPFTEGRCDGAPDPALPSFCQEGGGTESNYQKFKVDMETSNVRLRRQASSSCTGGDDIVQM